MRSSKKDLKQNENHLMRYLLQVRSLYSHWVWEAVLQLREKGLLLSSKMIWGDLGVQGS